jgi:hypothetical protein
MGKLEDCRPDIPAGKPVESIFSLRLHASAVPIQQLLLTVSNFEPGRAERLKILNPRKTRREKI